MSGNATEMLHGRLEKPPQAEGLPHIKPHNKLKQIFSRKAGSG